MARPGELGHVGTLSLKADPTVRTGLPCQANAAGRDIDSRHAKPANAEIHNVSADPTAKVEDKSSCRKGCCPVHHGAIRSCIAPVTRVFVAMSPYQLPTYSLV